jgi:exportin-5
LDNDVQNNEQYRTCAVKTLTVFKSVMPWATSQAIVEAQCVKHMCRSLAVSSVPIQMVNYMRLLSLELWLTPQGIYRGSPCIVRPYPFFR